mgnify:CR=1 FL=1
MPALLPRLHFSLLHAHVRPHPAHEAIAGFFGTRPGGADSIRALVFPLVASDDIGVHYTPSLRALVGTALKSPAEITPRARQEALDVVRALEETGQAPKMFDTLASAMEQAGSDCPQILRHSTHCPVHIVTQDADLLASAECWDGLIELANECTSARDSTRAPAGASLDGFCARTKTNPMMRTLAGTVILPPPESAHDRLSQRDHLPALASLIPQAMDFNPTFTDIVLDPLDPLDGA